MTCQQNGDAKLADLTMRYEDAFLCHHLDSGMAKGFVNHIILTDERPSFLPYWCVPPAEYQKLHQVLNAMEEKKNSQEVCQRVRLTCEFAFLVWKKTLDGSKKGQ